MLIPKLSIKCLYLLLIYLLPILKTFILYFIFMLINVKLLNNSLLYLIQLFKLLFM